jgi:dipeptidyl aminopeptidase/acylaminoacyl peptidase
MGGTLWQKPISYIENSPIFKADKVTTPLLIMHNPKDGLVPFSQGMEFFAALRRLNKPVWMLIYEEENHTIEDKVNQSDYTLRMMQFFDHYLKKIPSPNWMGLK